MKELFLSLYLLSLITGVSSGQTGFVDSKIIRKHIEILSGARMEGRQTASEGEKKAANYIQNKLMAFGIKPATSDDFRVPFPVYRDSVLQAAIAINDSSLSFNVDFGVFTDMNDDCDIKFSEFVFAGYGIHSDKYDDYKDLDVSGRLVVVYGGEPRKDGVYVMSASKQKSRWSFPPSKTQAATKLGAAALLIIDEKSNLALYNSPCSNLMNTPYKFVKNVNTFFITEDCAEILLGKYFNKVVTGLMNDTLPKLDPVETNIALSYSRRKFRQYGFNIIGTLEGTDKAAEYVLVSAHYDHLGLKKDEIFYGADDNASGTSSLLWIAEVLAERKRNGNGQRRSIVFAFFSGEENGLWGSKYYSDNPIYPLDKTAININIDMIGRIDNQYLSDPDSISYVFVLGEDMLSSELNQIVETSNKQTQLKLDRRYNNLKDKMHYFYRSDQFSFANKGVPVLFFCDGENPDYHKSSDTMEKINFELMNRRTQLVLNSVLEIANRDEFVRRDIQGFPLLK